MEMLFINSALVLMHDTGVDPAAGEGDERGAFVLVMTAPGYERLSDALALQNRQKIAPFRKNNLIFANHRRLLWDALRRIARGIEALHVQQVVHWTITAKNVFWDGTDIDTFRLGGYEKSPTFQWFCGAE